MKSKLLIFCLVIGLLNVHTNANAEANNKSTTKTVENTAAAASAAATTTTAAAISSSSAAALAQSINDHNDEKEANEATKDKRQIGSKDTPVYPNHRSDTNVDDDDDPEDPQETIYGAKPNHQFIIRPVAPHQHQQHEEHQQPQLRNYQAGGPVRPHSQQLLEQSQEIQHFAYLQDLSRNQPKATAAAQYQDKSRASQAKKATAAAAAASAQQQQQHPPTTADYSGGAEEAEQRYAVAIQQPQPRQFQTQPQYHQLQQQQHPQQLQQHPHPQQLQQHPQQQLQQPYQVIPEEHFLKLIEEELQARAYHEQQIRQQQTPNAVAASKQQHPQQQQQHQQTERSGQGLGSYRQREPAEEQSAGPTEYVQYVPRHRGGPKYLPLTQSQPQSQQEQQLQQLPQQLQLEEPEQELQPQQQHHQQPPPQQHQRLPPQLAYYQPQPQVSYKTLPNHPLAKSSLEKEIEKLLASNKAAVQIVDNSNADSAVVNQHRQPPQPRSPRPLVQPKGAYTATTPNSLLDANNQPFIPSLFQFSNYQTPTPIYPTPVPPQHIIDAKKLGPVVYPTAQPTQHTQALQQPSQYYYHETAPSTKPKTPYRAKQYGNKIIGATAAPPRDKELKYPTSPTKYAPPQQLVYEYERQPAPQHPQQQQHLTQAPTQQTGPIQFYPSPPDPSRRPSPQQPHQPHPTQPQHAPSLPQHPDFRQYSLPGAAPSQSSIFVSQSTGIQSSSRPPTQKPKTADDVKRLRLPQPGGKPLTQAEFQALIDAGYPVTAVPVPVPVPFEQYMRDHPEYRGQPPPAQQPDYSQLMRFAHQYGPQPRHHHQHHHAAAGSEPAVKIVSSPTASALGGGSITYLRPIGAEQKRRPRDEKETAVAGEKKEK